MYNMTELYRAVHTELYSAVQGCTGLYSAVQGCTGLYRAHYPGLTHSNQGPFSASVFLA